MPLGVAEGKKYDFRAYLNSAQSIPNTTFTKVNIDTENWDTDGVFDTTNKQYLPTQAGKYFVCGAVQIQDIVAGKLHLAMIYVNGVEHSRGTQIVHGGAGYVSAVVSALLSLDGDDYVELYTYHDIGSSKSLTTGSNITWLAGFRIA